MPRIESRHHAPPHLHFFSSCCDNRSRWAALTATCVNYLAPFVLRILGRSRTATPARPKMCSLCQNKREPRPGSAGSCRYTCISLTQVGTRRFSDNGSIWRVPRYPQNEYSMAVSPCLSKCQVSCSAGTTNEVSTAVGTLLFPRLSFMSTPPALTALVKTASNTGALQAKDGHT